MQSDSALVFDWQPKAKKGSIDVMSTAVPGSHWCAIRATTFIPHVTIERLRDFLLDESNMSGYDDLSESIEVRWGVHITLMMRFNFWTYLTIILLNYHDSNHIVHCDVVIQQPVLVVDERTSIPRLTYKAICSVYNLEWAPWRIPASYVTLDWSNLYAEKEGFVRDLKTLVGITSVRLQRHNQDVR
jgi:hypothetical protein